MQCVLFLFRFQLPPNNYFQQECFAAAVSETDCVINGSLDESCACTSYSLANRLGGHETGTQYAYSLCASESTCTEDDEELFSNAVNSICYNKDNSPIYNCGGGHVTPIASVTATGQNTITVSLNPTSTDTLTLDGYAKYTTTLESIPVYTTGQNKPLYTAVCPTRVVVGENLSSATGFPRPSSGDGWVTVTGTAVTAKVSASSASKSVVSGTPSSNNAVSTGGSTSGSATTTTAVSSTVTGAASGTSSSVSTTASAGGAGSIGGGMGVLGGVVMGVLAVLV